MHCIVILASHTAALLTMVLIGQVSSAAEKKARRKQRNG
jgi:hypothetical protein